MSELLVGVDVGGTFTDCLVVDPSTDTFRVAKVPTTPDDQSVGFMSGLKALGIEIGAVRTLVHGTTVATNAVLERRGRPCGLITTRGFRDILEMARRTRPQLFGLSGSFEPLVPRHLRLEVTERIDAGGRVIDELDEAEVEAAVEKLRQADVEAIVVHFMHAYANPRHEQRCLEIVRAAWPDVHVSAGHQVMPEAREFERGTATALNAYVQPLIATYVGRLGSSLTARGFSEELLIMQGNGGMMDVGVATRHAVQTLMSGPAAGALAAASLGERAGFPQLISCDMGGTSFDVCLVTGGNPTISHDKQLAYGLPVWLPMVDIHTIGAGGGSLARVSEGGILKVGPASAGAVPGPVSYGRGGVEPTVTDANVLLGRIDGAKVARLERETDLAAVRAAMDATVGRPLGLDAIDSAAAVLAVANNQMAGAIRFVSIAKGHDPRDFALFAFGGAGPLHAAGLARELGIPTVIVPRFPGITSALGCVLADVRHDFGQTINQPLDSVHGDEADRVLAAQHDAGLEVLAREHVDTLRVETVHQADLLFAGQTHVFRMPVSAPGFDPAAISKEFNRRYTERFEVDLSEMRPVLMALRTTVIGVRRDFDDRALFGAPPGDGREDAQIGERSVWFQGRFAPTPIFDRDRLAAGGEIEGPAIIEQMDTTIAIEPGDLARVDDRGNIVIAIG